MQKTTFKYEIIIHDDGSTDRTIDIIKKYVKLYPNIVRLIAEKENKYSQGGIPYIYRTCVYPYVRGKFVAYCEGDDYWIDNKKLQIQFEYMEKNPKCSLVFHNAIAFNLLTNKKYKMMKITKRYYKISKKYNVGDLAKLDFIQ